MTSPDVYVATAEPEKPRVLCPAGPLAVVCVDGVFLGKTVDQYPGNPPKLVEKYALIYQVGEIHPETGRRFELSREFTVSMHEKAALRKWLETWRNKKYTDDEARNVPLHKVVGQCGMALVEHKTSKSGNDYAKLASIMPLPKGMPPLVAEGYERAPWWDQKKAEYLAQADAFLAMQEAQNAARKPAMAGGVASDPGFPAALADDTDDGCPF